MENKYWYGEQENESEQGGFAVSYVDHLTAEDAYKLSAKFAEIAGVFCHLVVALYFGSQWMLRIPEGSRITVEAPRLEVAVVFLVHLNVPSSCFEVCIPLSHF